MKKVRVLILSGFMTLLLALVPVQASAAEAAGGSREFMLSCVYGAVAGTLVGTATLAFTDKPNQNLNRVARGASLGLYAGMILGFYVVYGTSEDDMDPVVFAPAPVIDDVTGNTNGGMLMTAFSF